MNEGAISSNELENLTTTIKNTYNVDFTGYAESSFRRRIERILELKKISTINDLINKVLVDKNFFEGFVKEVTVNTTEMFRDPFVWTKIKDEIVPKLANKEIIRIWHAACSSGEEVLSMAILLKESGLLERTNFFATDLDEDILEIAENSIYYKRNLEQYEDNYKQFGGKGRLSDYYSVHSDGKITFDKTLTQNVQFKKFNLVNDTNTLKFDFILCRNVLIYFNQEVQNQVLDLFIKSLFTGGYLMVGAKETISLSINASHFETLFNAERIYRKL